MFHNKCINVAVAQLIERLAGVPKDPGPVHGQEELFSLKFLFKRK